MKREKGETDNKVKYGTISLPMTLIDLIKKKIKGTGMNSVSAYVAFVLRQIFSSPETTDKILDKKEEEELKNRLKKLGYL